MGADLGLIDAATLNGNQAGWIVLDARPKSEWAAGHIPGARSFSWENYTRTDAKGVQYRVFPPQEMAAALGALGIDEKSPIVIYGDADKSWGGEGWDAWVLSWLGHQGPIRVLNGGIQSWLGKNLPMSKLAERPAAKKGIYLVHLKPQLDIATEELERRKGQLSIVDVRSTLEWFKGKIPGAVHIPWDDFYTGKEKRPLSAQQLKKLLADHGVDTRRPVVYYCLGGIRSGYAWLVHELSGLPEARNYEGGMAAWQKTGSH
jgi:thiosulfate/3-mercaptopyruvate sulfurtransferase